MRRTLPILLSGLVLAATIVSVTATVDDSSDGGVTSVSVTRKSGDPPTYSVTLCEVSPCPVSGTRTVTLGPNTLKIRKNAGGWQWQVEDEDHNVIGGGWHDIPGGWVDQGDGTCCITISGITDSGAGNPAQAQPNTPAPGQTTYTLSFSASDGSDTTSSGSLRWTEA